MRVVVFVAIAVILAVLYSCKGTKEETSIAQTSGLSKYVYIDDNDILHINPMCRKLRDGNDDDGHEIYAKHMIDTSEFVISNMQYFRVCSRCVGDKEYEQLLSISQNNSWSPDTNVLEY